MQLSGMFVFYSTMFSELVVHNLYPQVVCKLELQKSSFETL